MASDPISPVGTSKPELTISPPAVNDEPIELDGTPTSPEQLKNGRRRSKQDDPSPEEKEVPIVAILRMKSYADT